MFILWMACVFHLIFAENEQPHSDPEPDPDVSVQELKPQEIIQKSLREVNEMLYLLHENISYERKMLSELEAKGFLSPEVINVSAIAGDIPKRSQNPEILSVIAKWARNKREKLLHPPRTASTRASPPIVAMRRGIANSINVRLKGTITPDTVGDLSHETVPKGALQLVPEWASDDRTSSNETTMTANLTTLTAVVIPKPNKKEDMKDIMKNFNVGYHYAAMVGVNGICADKNVSDLKALLTPLGKLIVEMADQGSLDFFGEKLVKRIKVIWLWITVLDVNVVKAFAQEAQTNFELHNRFADDIHEIFLELDRLYDAEEGEKLHNIVDEMDKYNVGEHGPDTGKELMHGFLNALINRIKGSMELEGLIEMANVIYTNRYADLKQSETFNALDSFFGSETEDMPDTRRRLKITHYIKTKYKKIIKHLIKKHPTLSKYLFAHKGKHHHSKKRHHTRHHKKHQSYKKQRHHHYKVKKSLNLAIETSQISTQENKETFPVSVLQISQNSKFNEIPISSIYRSTSTTFRPVSVTFSNLDKNQKRFKIVLDRNNLPDKRISRSSIRRTKLFDKSHHGKTGNNLKHFLINKRLKASGAKIVKINEVLHAGAKL